MANRTGRNSLDQDRIVIAIHHHTYHLQGITAGFPFHPQTILGAAEESHLSGFSCFLIGFFIHKAQHQYFVGIVILNDCRDKPAHFFKI